jgi:hypothetical protein
LNAAGDEFVLRKSWTMDPKKLDRPMMAFAIAEEISKIKADQPSTNKGKRSAVLAKNEHLSIVFGHAREG